MAEIQWDNLPVGIRKSAAGDSYEIGVTVEGAFLVFGSFKPGGLEDDLAEAKEAADAAAAAAPAPAAEPPTPPEQQAGGGTPVRTPAAAPTPPPA